MHNLLPILISLILLSACDRPGDAGGGNTPAVTTRPSIVSGNSLKGHAAAHWVLQPNANVTVLMLRSPSGARIMSLGCAPETKLLKINVAGFTPISSEDRLSFGSSGKAEAFVVDVHGDTPLGGVSAQGAVPADLSDLLSDSVSSSYGNQASGPHPPVARGVLEPFVAACRKVAATATRGKASPGRPVSPCLTQDGQQLASKALRAMGTEPFWAARIEGRCVTYSRSDDQAGTRVWARFTPTTDGGLWAGSLAGRQFILRSRFAPGCSDGMSDKRYPMAVELLVNGEKRNGCGEPL